MSRLSKGNLGESSRALNQPDLDLQHTDRGLEASFAALAGFS